VVIGSDFRYSLAVCEHDGTPVNELGVFDVYPSTAFLRSSSNTDFHLKFAMTAFATCWSNFCNLIFRRVIGFRVLDR